MALALARSLVKLGGFDADAVRDAYVSWLDSGPFDVGNTVSSGLHGYLKPGQPGERGADAGESAGDIRGEP